MAETKSPSDQLSELIEGVKAEAYNHGFCDATRLMADALSKLRAEAIEEQRTAAEIGIGARKPPGHNRDTVVSILQEIGGQGMTQAKILQAATRKGEKMAQSSLRYALKQLHREKTIEPHGRRWRLVSSPEKAAGAPAQATPAVSGTSNQGGQSMPRSFGTRCPVVQW